MTLVVEEVRGIMSFEKGRSVFRAGSRGLARQLVASGCGCTGGRLRV